jgi:hypothetical protein
MSTYLREGLEIRLAQLEDLHLQWLGESDPPLVCATCYEMSDECNCPAPVAWPLPAVVYRLRAELSGHF